jgi:hypothetical protein
LKLALAEQSEHYDGMIATNRQTMESNSRMFNAAVNIALAALGCGGLVFFYWMATRVG